MAQAHPQTAAPARKKGKLSDLAKAEERTAWLLLLPTIIVLVAIAIYPFGRVFFSSFTNARFASAAPTEFVGLNNYANLLSFTIRAVPYEVNEAGERVFDNPRVFLRRATQGTGRSFDAVSTFNLFGNRYVFGATNAPFVRSIIDTVIFTVVAVFLETLLGMIIALTLQAKFFGRGIMRTAMLVPWAIITVVSALIWQWMFNSARYGFFNSVLSRLGWVDSPVNFLTNPSLQLPSIIAVDVWKTTPFMALLLLAGLSTIPSDIYEAARVDGANKIRQFFSITLPLLAPTLAVALVFRTLDSLRVFDLFQVVYGESRFSMASYTYYTLVANRNVGLSSAASVVIFFIIFIFAIIYIRALGVQGDD
jgi:trehalose/maltose transport system permease protein